MKVEIERHVEQVVDGSHYKGHVKIGKATFNYELKFTIPIPQLDDMEPAKDVPEIRRTFVLTVEKDGQRIELTNDEYGFFFHLLVEFVLHFYNNPQTRDNNEGLVGLAARGDGPLSHLVSVSFGMDSTVTFTLPEQVHQMLNGAKFNCELVSL